MPKYVYKEQTPETLTAMADALLENAQILRQAAESMKANGFTELLVTHDDQREKGLEYIDNFTFAVRTAQRVAREKRGDFQPKLTKKQKLDTMKDESKPKARKPA